MHLCPHRSSNGTTGNKAGRRKPGAGHPRLHTLMRRSAAGTEIPGSTGQSPEQALARGPMAMFLAQPSPLTSNLRIKETPVSLNSIV